ncbi:hypothetical protein FY036_00440 [Mesorhizobium microcysteis]|uniref:Uncharacterized protein n=1 Tax=Neoaquamicrobium microcysteis TaxID=2682781 RepID=A0A5D4HC86_9HYPH|nr:hypothetical protein [Mesorhizobium microcysteis]TYR37145.1 hypothetical protein FY036_00440 [Mesorhizobium microcysteis]
MSSGYLTPKEMETIERVLAEVRDPSENRSFDKESARARILIDASGQGTRTEAELRVLLAQHVALHQTIDYPQERWENEGGSVT